MKNLRIKLVSFVTFLATVASIVSPFAARAADIPPTSAQVGEWSVSTLAKDGADWKIESYKVDRALAVWSEVNSASTKRRLYAFDGVKSRLLAEMPVADWNNLDTYFVENVAGAYDAADGLVVWIMNDGADREVYVFDGDAVKKVSDNTYDDRHPVTGAGRIAWSSYPTANQYNLMVKEADGRLVRLSSWHILNYAFSGKTLFWQNIQPNENWFSVYRNDGKNTFVVGKGDDRPLTKYFLTDGKGSAAWEYSTKSWEYDKRETFISYQGSPALRVLQRDVPPRNTRLEDTDGTSVIVNVFDWQYRRITERNALIQADFAGEKAISEKVAMSKVRFMNGGYVMHREPEANISLVLRGSHGEDIITEGAVIMDMFDADGPSAAGGRVGGGMYLHTEGKTDLVASTVETSSVAVKNGDVAWTEGVAGSKVLKFAGKSVVVKAAYGAKRATGYLVKAAGSSAVYLAAEDGRRYLFPSSKEFFDWYEGFGSVRTVPAAALAKIPLSGKVLFRGGEHLLKTKTTSKVYVIGDNGRIHALASENAAKDVFGNDWKTRIITVGDSQLADYEVGASISDRLSYFATLAKQTVR
jgi:hypothetical protein